MVHIVGDCAYNCDEEEERIMMKSDRAVIVEFRLDESRKNGLGRLQAIKKKAFKEKLI